MGFFDSLMNDKTMNKTRSELMYDNALTLFNSAALQNQTAPPALRQQMEAGEDCDMVSHGSGRFGHDASNPIPVNGKLGALTYLSRLRLRNTGSMVFFHQLERKGHIACFELVNVSGKFVDYLYLDLYHPRASRRYPEGYTLEKEAVFPRGVTEEVPEFPKGLQKAIKKEAKQFLGVDVAEKESARIDIQQAWQSLQDARKSRRV